MATCLVGSNIIFYYTNFNKWWSRVNALQIWIQNWCKQNQKCFVCIEVWTRISRMNKPTPPRRCSFYMFVCLSVFQYVCLSIFLYVCLSVCLSLYMFVWLNISPDRVQKNLRDPKISQRILFQPWPARYSKRAIS